MTQGHVMGGPAKKAETASSNANEDNSAGFVNVAFSNHGDSGDYGSFGDKVIRRKSANAQGLQLDNNNGDESLKSNHGYAASSDPSAAPIDFDDILPMIGEFGVYQKMLFLCMIPFAFFVAFVYFSQIFMTLIPEQHWCHVPALDNLSMDAR